MQDPALLLASAGLAVAGLGLASLAGLRGWNEWLELKRLELVRGPSPAARADISEVRERVRRLEAIARGTEA